MPKQATQLRVFSVVYYGLLEDKPKINAALRLLCSKFVYQFERGEKKQKDHWQIFCRTKAKLRPAQFAKKLNVAHILAPCVAICSTNGREALANYCMKKDTRLSGPWADKPIYLGGDLPTTLRPWQQELSDLLDGPIDSRRLHWYYDPYGGAGKSTFAKYMYFHKKIITLTFGTADNLLNLVYKMQGLRTYMFDLSRTKGKKSSMSDIYQALESVKNGYFANTKYETGLACFERPHVIVFSNYPPDLKALSPGRWIIHNIGEIEPIEPGKSIVECNETAGASADNSGAPDFPISSQKQEVLDFITRWDDEDDDEMIV